MKISTLKKVRAPGRIEFHRGLECEREACCSRLVAGRGEQKGAEGDGLIKTPFGRRAPLTLSERLPDEVADRQTGADVDSDGGFVHGSNLLKVQFSTALLPQRLSVSCDSDNTDNVAYMGLKVKSNRKSLSFKAFSVIPYWIKKFSSPKIKIWFAPMFFSGFFCGFERYGSAAFPNFRGGNSLPCRQAGSPPQAAKCVRTNSRILRHVKYVNKKYRPFQSDSH